MADPEADVRRFFEEVWNQGNVAAAGDFLAAEFTSHNTFDVAILGPDEYGRAVLDYRTAFPDLTVTLEDVFASGDRVAVRGIDRGTHQGEFMGHAATGRPMTATWIEIFRIHTGKAVEAGWKQTCGDCWTRFPDNDGHHAGFTRPIGQAWALGATTCGRKPTTWPAPKYCSGDCRTAAHRARHQAADPAA
jgi:predicted ester cyclase